MMIERIDENNKKELWDFIKNNKSDFFFEIREYLNNFTESTYWLAKENDQVVGLLFFDKAKTLRLIGSEIIVKNFLDNFNLIPKYLNIPATTLNLMAKYVRSEKKRLNMIRLTMEKATIEFSQNLDFVLRKNDLPEALAIFQAAEPEDWATSQADKFPIDAINRWYAIKHNDQFVSVCWNQVYPHGGHIAFIATHPEHQNKGYATALVKFALYDTFKSTDFAIIHVREDNAPALHTYRKLGYKDHMSYSVLCEPEMID